MENWYKILGVPSTATAAEIKRAFRKKVKALHPDTSGSAENSEDFRLLVRAYEVLSDIHRRSIFDVSFAAFAKRSGDAAKTDDFDYRRWLLSKNDSESRAKLIFFDLLHGREDDAVSEFVRVSSERSGFSLADWFVREDFMDFGFILCEELVLRAQYYDAALLLIRIVEMEQSFPYFRHFFPEVLSLAKDVLLRRLEGAVSDELALDAWERAIELGLGRSEEASILVKMGCAYSRIGDLQAAHACFAEALRLDKRIKIPMERGFYDTPKK